MGVNHDPKQSELSDVGIVVICPDLSPTLQMEGGMPKYVRDAWCDIGERPGDDLVILGFPKLQRIKRWTTKLPPWVNTH